MRTYQRICPAKGADVYIAAIEAARLIGCSPAQFDGLVGEGRIGTWQLPGARRRFSRSDCERVRDSAFTDATS